MARIKDKLTDLVNKQKKRATLDEEAIARMKKVAEEAKKAGSQAKSDKGEQSR